MTWLAVYWVACAALVVSGTWHELKGYSPWVRAVSHAIQVGVAPVVVPWAFIESVAGSFRDEFLPPILKAMKDDPLDGPEEECSADCERWGKGKCRRVCLDAARDRKRRCH